LPTTPTMSMFFQKRESEAETNWPRGLLPAGIKWRTKSSFTITTGGAIPSSRIEKSRPILSGMLKASKKPGETPKKTMSSSDATLPLT
jgi:hypothetical protein